MIDNRVLDRVEHTPGSVYPTLPEHIRFGHGISDDLVEFLDADPVTRTSRRPLLVLGGTSRNAVWAEKLIGALRHRFDADLTVVTRLGDQLTVEEADRLIGEARQHGPDLVIGIGGGSVLDAAKVVAMVSGSAFTMREAAADPTSIRQILPVVAVPTTPGSGSEATPTATIWDLAVRRKLALDDPRLMPRLAIVDPLLTRTMPLRALAAAALDGLAHGVESAWSTKSTADSRAHALYCVRLIAANLARYLQDRDDLTALSAVSLGAAHGGVAISTTRTTLAHALSYPLTAWHQLPHGHACALMLGPVARFNGDVTTADCDDPRGVDFVGSALASVLDAMGVESVPEIGAMLTELCATAGLPTLEELGDIDTTLIIEEAGSYDRSGNNPRRLDPNYLVPLLDCRSRDNKRTTVPASTVRIDPVKLMRWLNARKTTVSAFGTAVGIDAGQLDTDITDDVLVWGGDLVERAAEILDIEIGQLEARPKAQPAVYLCAAESEAARRVVRRDGIDFYIYYTLAAPHGHVAPVMLDILCPQDRLPELNRGHLEPAITVNLGPGDINGRWGKELTSDTWQVLSANAEQDRWITGDSYFEPSFCPHTYSLTTDVPARILSYTGASPLAGLVDRTDTWPTESFAALLEGLGERLTPAAVLGQAMRRRSFDVNSLCAAANVAKQAVENFQNGVEHALDLSALRRIGATIQCDYRLLLPADVNRDRLGKSSRTLAESRTSIRSMGEYTVADMAGSAAAPDLLGQFLHVDRANHGEVLDLRDPAATFYLMTEGTATAYWRGDGGEMFQQKLSRWDSLWIGPHVAHGFTGRADMLRMGDAGTYSYLDTLELSNTYRPAWTLRRARQDRQGWGYDK